MKLGKLVSRNGEMFVAIPLWYRLPRAIYFAFRMWTPFGEYKVSPSTAWRVSWDVVWRDSDRKLHPCEVASAKAVR